MDDSQRYRIDQWVEDTLYHNLEQLRGKGSIDIAALAALTPLIQLYQARQLKNIEDQLSTLSQILIDGDLSIVMKSTWKGLDVNIKEIPQEKPLQPEKNPTSLRMPPLPSQRKRQDE